MSSAAVKVYNASDKVLAEKIQAMTREEWAVVLENIPVDMMLVQIQKELDKNREFITRITGVTSAFSN